MSAFVVSDRHIDALLTWVINTPEYGAPQKLDGMTVYDQPGLIGQLLVDENHRSVNHRYDEKDNHKYKFNRYPRTLTPVEVIKACDCLIYQSCETDNWKVSRAYKIIRDIRESAINALPGMEDAAWEIEE